MARKHSKAGKKRTHKQRKHRGGGWGFTGPSSIPGAPGTVSNPQVFTGIGDCRAVQPGYDIPYSQYGASFKGLPGMSGGKRTRKGSKGKKTRKQRGGRYGFFPEGAADVTPNGAAWWAGTYPPVQRIGCEGGSYNPLNPTHTGSSAPAGAANPNYYLKGGAQLAPATYGVGNVDSMYYYGPTAGYANTASTWKDSVGAPVQIQVPFAARSMNQACLTTGGSPPLTGALQKGGKHTRKSRRGGGYYGIPTSWGNVQGYASQLGSLFGFGASAAPAENATALPLQGPAQPPAAIVTNGANGNGNRRGNGNNNRRGNGNNNRGANGNANGRVTNNGLGMNGEAPETQAPAASMNVNSLTLPNRNNSVPMPAEPAPVTPPPTPEGNALGATTTPTSVETTETSMTNNPSMATFGGRGRRKSRRSKRSALQKKKV